MQNIYTNPSRERSLIQNLVKESKQSIYLELDLGNYNNTKKILIFKNREYNFIYLDPYTGEKRIINGLVIDILEEYIKVQVLIKFNCSTCPNTDKCKNKNNCTINCIYNTNVNNSEYNTTKTYFIPIANIFDVSYIINNPEGKPTKPKEETHIMLLGISAEVVKAVIIRLQFFDDNVDEAVKYVDLKAGNIYDIAYECKHKQTIYESRIKVVKIEECEQECANCSCQCINKDFYMHNHRHDFCKPGKGFVRENVGANDSIYVYHDCPNKNDFMSAPPVKKIRIIVDTSEDFSGRYEAIMLDSIRNCNLVYEEVSDNKEIPCVTGNMRHSCYSCTHRHPGCESACDSYSNSSCTTYEYTYDNKYKATVVGDEVKIYADGKASTIDLDTILKFYLGVD